MRIKKITIIGGGGEMGFWFSQFFLETGAEVFISDKNKKKLSFVSKKLNVKTVKNNIEAVKKADFILISVLLKDFEKIIKEIAPYLKENQIILDITSLKELPVKIMHKYIKKGIVLGTHPLFGPTAKAKNQNFVLTPINNKEKIFADEFKKWLENKGFKVIIISPQKHDELMTIVLGLSHFIGLVTSSVLSSLNLKELNKVSGPSFKKLLDLVKNVVFSQPKFYSDLHLNLPKINKIEELFEKKVKEWRKIVKNKDKEKFIRKMIKLRKCFTK